MRRVIRAVVLAGVVLAVATPVLAQSRPLVTEDPETVGQGQILLEAGIDYSREEFFPASGLQGNFWRIGTFGLSFGVSSIAEIQLDGGIRNSTSDVGDLSIGAKIKIMTEGISRPSLAIRFSTKLPNAGNESGLGLDTTDFSFGFAMAKTVQSIRFVGNAGFAILGDPVRGDRQNDVFTYGVSVARAIAEGLEVVAEVNGRANTRSNTVPIGTESRSVIRVGSRLTRGPVRLDGALVLGVTERDPTWGLSTGFTWVFNAFRTP
jgi:hypothetical protein